MAIIGSDAALTINGSDLIAPGPSPGILAMGGRRRCDRSPTARATTRRTLSVQPIPASASRACRGPRSAWRRHFRTRDRHQRRSDAVRELPEPSSPALPGGGLGGRTLLGRGETDRRADACRAIAIGPHASRRDGPRTAHLPRARQILLLRRTPPRAAGYPSLGRSIQVERFAPACRVRWSDSPQGAPRTGANRPTPFAGCPTVMTGRVASARGRQTAEIAGITSFLGEDVRGTSVRP